MHKVMVVVEYLEPVGETSSGGKGHGNFVERVAMPLLPPGNPGEVRLARDVSAVSISKR
jgi:hypothetical protein